METVHPEPPDWVVSLESAASPDDVEQGRTCARDGRVWGVQAVQGGSRPAVTGSVLDADGRAREVRISLVPGGASALCDCGGAPVCAHAVGLARAWTTREMDRDGSTGTWKDVLEGLVRRPVVDRPLPRGAVVVHWLELLPGPRGTGRLRFGWRAHRPGGRRLGPGRIVRPDAVRALAAQGTTGVDAGVLRAVEAAVADADRSGEGVVIRGLAVDPVLRALVHAPHVRWIGTREPVVFDLRPVRLRIEGRYDADPLILEGRLLGIAAPAAGEGSEVCVVGSGPPWVVQEGCLRPVVGIDRGEPLARLLDAGARIPSADLPAFLGSTVPDLESCGVVVHLEGVEGRGGVVAARPRPRLYLSEEDADLVGLLRFAYGDYEIAAENPDVAFRVHGVSGGQWLQRDMEAEFESTRTLLDMGLETDGPGRFRVGGDRALGFLAERLPDLVDPWEIYGEEALVRHRLSPVSLTARLKLGGGVDWLDLDVEVQAGEQSVPVAHVLRALRAGSRYVRLGDGAHARLTEGWLERAAPLLRDLGLDGGPVRLPTYLAPLLEELEDLGVSPECEDPGAWAELRRCLRDHSLPEEAPPSGLKATLRPYQLEGFRWLRFHGELGFGAILADDMGLGKTVQALAVLQAEVEAGVPGPHLVVAPTSVVPNWEAEARRFTPDLTVVRHHGSDRHGRAGDLARADLVVTSYAVVRRDLELLGSLDWNYVILDEAQAIKNAATQTAAAVRTLSSRRRLALTGTPLENHLGELWSQFAFLMPGLLGTESQFVERFARPVSLGDDQARDRLRRRIGPFVLRRLKKQVAPDLPEKTESVLWCEMGDAQRALYRSLLVASREKVLQELAEQGMGRARFSILEALLRLRQACCLPAVLPGGIGEGVPSAKVDAFRQFVTEVLDEGHRILVFSQFVQVLEHLRRWFDDEGIAHEYLDGRTRNREERVRRFQEDDCVRAFLVSLKAGGAGLNLTGADYVILFDPWWNPAVEAQATDRAHRIGQTRRVFAYRMVTRDSVEEKILALQKRKRALNEILLSGDESGWGTLDEGEIENLFSE